MNTEEMNARYLALYNDMASSKDVSKMRSFGAAERWAFREMTEYAPQRAQEWLDKLEAGAWNNYVSPSEYSKVSSLLVHQNGSKGAKWSYEDIMKAVDNLGGEKEKEPCYNSYALALTMNMIYSDHANSISDYVPQEDMVAFVYAQAVEKLTDADRPRSIREYFSL